MSVADLPSPDDAGAANPFAAAIENTLQPLGKARHAPGDIYGSDHMFELEKQKIFMKDWMCVARGEEIASAGDYMTFRMVGEPFVITRNEQGAIAAFANVCAHRGVEVASGEGNTKEFSCPYHGWLYDLNGRLVGAPYMKEAEGFGIDLNAGVSCGVALAMYGTAYNAEIFRAGIQSIERGQVEAAQSIGLSPFHTFLHIVLPQAFRRMIPPLVNESITLLKFSSLVSVLGVADLTYQAQVLATTTFRPIEIFTFIAIIYFFLCGSLALLARIVERRMSRAYA